MRQLPGWYLEAIQRHARLIVAQEETTDQAIVSLRILVRDTHSEFGNVVLDDWNAPHLEAAVRDARPRPVHVPPQVLVAFADKRPVSQEMAPPGIVEAMVEQRLALKDTGGNVVLTSAGEEAAREVRKRGLQQSLFPDLPPSLKVTPTKYRPVYAMTKHELETAKAVWTAKTQNSIDGAEAERKRLNAFYQKVHPKMDDAETVADVLERLQRVATHR